MLGMGKFVAKENRQHVELWDVIKENNPKNCKWAYVQMMPNEDYALVCGDLFTDHGLSNGDETGLY